jgi:hypothetical protein
MKSSIVAVALFAGVSLASSQALAQEGPCGKFDFSGGLDCRIEVSGGCTAKCTPLSFEAGCTGGCQAPPDPACVETACGEACIAECDPALLDCFQGCHDECDAEVQAQCEAEASGVDCAEQAIAQCNMHCKEACKVPPSDCQEHCEQCCTGSCFTLSNFSCDFDCFAELQGGCEVQCSDPKGALFCNGQYVYASDIDACIEYLVTQGISVDVSAQGSASCTGGNCAATGKVKAGCSTSPATARDTGGAAALLGLVLAGIAQGLRRRRS